MAHGARAAERERSGHRGGGATALRAAVATLALLSLFVAGPELISPVFDPAPLHRVLGGWLIVIGVSAALSVFVLTHARRARSRRRPSGSPNALPNTDAGGEQTQHTDHTEETDGCIDLEEELDRAMAEDRLYTDPDLTLPDLADSLGQTRHRVSQCLNGYIGDSFYDYLARYRIRHAERLLREHPEQSILEVAFASGFSSKATFNRQFKEVTGRSPSSVRASTQGVRAAAYAPEA
jgi:AraC-like DNA-binding protein